jgi:transposase
MPKGIRTLLAALSAPQNEGNDVPDLARRALEPMALGLVELGKRIEVDIVREHRGNETSRRLETIPGFHVMTSTAMAATVADPTAFKSGREFAAWLGLTPRENSSGGKQRLGGITKMGDGYLRTLLVVGATAVIRFAREEGSAKTAWIRKLMEKKPAKVVAVALANKMARIAWAIMTRREVYRVIPA